MKTPKAWIWVVLSGLLILPTSGVAETAYVSENFEITMRTGPGVDRKIISLVKSGRALDVLEKGEEWSMVRTQSGREGWVLNRYLTADQPSAMVLERIKQDYDVLAAKYKDLKEKSADLDQQKKSTEADLSQSRQNSNQLNTAYEKLKKESAGFLKLKKQYKKATSELEAEKNRSAKLENENMQMARNRNIQWVLTGGGILLAGFFIGLFSSSRRKQRPALY